MPKQIIIIIITRNNKENRNKYTTSYRNNDKIIKEVYNMRLFRYLLELLGFINEEEIFLADSLDETARQDGYRDPRYEWNNSLEVKRDNRNLPIKKSLDD